MNMKEEIEDKELQMSKLQGELDELKTDIRISVKRENWTKLRGELKEYKQLLDKLNKIVPEINEKVEKLIKK